EKLELRLDNVVYRLGLAGSRRQARQYVNHGHVLVNDEEIDIPSYSVEPGDEIALRDRMKNNPQVEESISLAQQRGIKEWLHLADGSKGRVEREPQRSEIEQVDIEESLIVELYSK
ncbi:MAG: 30S ribosomal protein S4, partial [bacterium]